MRRSRELAGGHEASSEAQAEGRDTGAADSNSGPTADVGRRPQYGAPALDARLASDEWADVLPDRYRFEGAVISWGGAVEQYKNERKGQDVSAEANGWRNTLHQRARRKCSVLHQADCTIRPELENPTMSFLTFAGAYDPTRVERYAHIIDYTVELAEAVDATMATHRYQVRRECSTEWVLIIGGSERGVSHFHMVGWHDGELERDRFVAVRDRFVDECDVATESSNPPAEAVKLDPDPNSGLEEYPADPRGQPVHPFARDAANQLPHLGRIDDHLDAFEGMSQGELRFSVVADALPSSVSTWRASIGVPSIDSVLA